jgi:hypothetical protein
MDSTRSDEVQVPPRDTSCAACLGQLTRGLVLSRDHRRPQFTPEEFVIRPSDDPGPQRFQGAPRIGRDLANSGRAA